MRNGTLLLLVTILSAASARADGIRYDQIPADVSGYAHMDLDRFLSSQLYHHWDGGKFMAAQVNAFLGEHSDVTMYTPKSPGPGGFVLLLHVQNSKLIPRVQAKLAVAEDTVLITYAKQEIHYVAEGITSLFMDPAGKVDFPPQDPREQTKKPNYSISMGLGEESGPSSQSLEKGPSFIAIVGQDLFIVAGDLPSMAGALDAIGGKKPSLATRDPQGLKIDSPPGVFFIGAGVHAQIDKIKKDDPSAEGAGSTTRPSATAGSSAADSGTKVFGGDLSFDMFGTFKGQARLARFDMGEDQQQVFVDGSVGMKDAASAGQLKNLIIGVEALISLTRADAKPLIDPLDAQLDKKSVVLHWSWPVAKLPELFRLTQALDHDKNPSTADPTTQPTH